MLVIRRKPGETFVIAGTIIVTVLAIKEGRVKIGIEAPDDVAIVREELLTKHRLEEPRAAIVEAWLERNSA